LDKFLTILTPFSSRIHVITGYFQKHSNDQNISITKINFAISKKEPLALKILKSAVMLIKISFHTLRRVGDTDLFIFFLGAVQFFFPLLIVKISRKRVIGILTQAPSKIERSICLPLLNLIVIDVNIGSENLLQRFGLLKYKGKISFGGSLYIDTKRFICVKELRKRENVIGYVGRLSTEKGVMNFVKSIPLLLRERPDLKFLIIGEGPLFHEIESYLNESGLREKVTLTGWIPNEKIPDFLNEMKIIVVPSYTETLPVIILESMACGTPVIATSVGAIPELVVDGETGFQLKDNSPELIARKCLQVLNYPNLDKIVTNALRVIEKYECKTVIKNYKKIIEN
jgi:glycosyltransferase involved in cell wall biosynthesis